MGVEEKNKNKSEEEKSEVRNLDYKQFQIKLRIKAIMISN